MEFKISGRHIEITEPIHDYAEKKMSRVHKYFDRVQEVQVVVDKHDRNFDVEVIVDVEHHEPFIARHQEEDLYACLDQALDKMERQLTDHKEKLRNRKHLA
jgi:putative sigma-54 modulation protein